MTQYGAEHLLFSRLPSKRRLRSGRLGAVLGSDFPRITIPCQRAELLSDRTTDYLLQSPSWHRRQLAYGVDVEPGQPRLSSRTHSPHQFDWKIVKKTKLGLRVDNY